MADIADVSKPLKTWSHLAGNKRRPSEYEIVSTNLLWNTDDRKAPWAMSPELPLSRWIIRNRNESPLQHADWDAFRDPEQLVYRTYTLLQDGQEAYVDGLLDDHSRNRHDDGLTPDWVAVLARLYTPARFLIHAVQLASAYLVTVAPSSTVENCLILQAADQLRWVSRIAYRTVELAAAHPQAGFARDERRRWEDDPAWQGFRELLERLLVTWDLGEHLTALNLVVKPAIDEVFLRQFAQSARSQGDGLTAQLLDAQYADSERSRRWTAALVDFVLQHEGGANRRHLAGWIDKWTPLADRAIEAFAAGLPGGDAAAARRNAAAFRARVGF